MDGNDAVAGFVWEMSWDTVPEDVRTRARISLLDNLGATLGGTLTRISDISARYAADSWSGDAATILRHRLRASAAGAAFANANAGNALDIDDDQSFTRGHPGVQLFPAALAVAEKVGASGRDLLEGMIVGYEVAPRMGLVQHATTELYRACGSWGSVACAAAAARLLGLEPDQVKHALGIAEYHAPYVPVMRDIASPAMVKHGIGWGAMTGVTAAELARAGYTGIPSLLGSPEFAARVADIGRTYLLPDTVFFKDWASCAWGHPGATAALSLLHANELDLNEVEAIRVYTFREAIELYQGYPTTTEEAQFSVMWPIAALLVDGELGPRQMLEERFTDPEIRSVVDRIELILDPEIEALSQEAREEDILMYSRVEFALRDGRVLDSGVVERGAKEFTVEQLEDKFRWLVGQVLDAELVQRLIDAVWEFENVDDVREFTAWLR